VTIECGDCGTKTVFTDPDMYSLLEETIFYADCMRYDENNGFKEYCSNHAPHGSEMEKNEDVTLKGEIT